MIAESGGIPALVALVGGGEAELRQWAAYALSNLAETEAIRAAIADAGGIKPLVALAGPGSEGQYFGADEHLYAANALANLAASNGANQRAIAAAGGIVPLVALTRDSSAGQRRVAAIAACALGQLAAKNSANQAAVVQAGGVKPLVALLRGGHTQQQQWAAHALGMLASSAAGRRLVADAGALPALAGLATGRKSRATRAVRQEAGYALDALRAPTPLQYALIATLLLACLWAYLSIEGLPPPLLLLLSCCIVLGGYFSSCELNLMLLKRNRLKVE